MATYSEKDFNTSHYNTARPSYPDQFYQTLLKYHNAGSDTHIDLAVDVGCGSGFVAFKLVKYFQKVVGTDISEIMVRQCNCDTRTIANNGRIEFAVAPGEQFPDFIEPNSVDLITGAECCHWMDHPAFFSECARVLKKGATLAYWFYLDPMFIGNTEANEIYMDYAYGSSVELYQDKYERFFGPFYEQPGHNFLRTAMAEVNPPEEQFTDIIRHHYIPSEQTNGPEYTTLYIERNVSLRIYRDYVTSWSGYHNWKKVHADKPDTVDQFMEELSEALGVDLDTPVKIVFPTVYTFARKR